MGDGSSSKTNKSRESDDSSGQSVMIQEYFKDMESSANGYISAANDYFNSIGSGLIGPSSDIASNGNLKDYSNSTALKLANQEALLWAGIYSMSKTGDAGALAKALDMKNATLEDIRNMRSNVKTINNPNASRGAKIASAAYLQRSFGIDAAKDYAHLNQAELGMDSIKAEIGKSFLALGESQKSVYNKMQMLGAKSVKEQLISGGILSALKNASAAFHLRYLAAIESGDKNAADDAKTKYEAVDKRFLSAMQGSASTEEKAENAE